MNIWEIVRCTGYNYTANVYRQTTDELMFKSVISTQKKTVKLSKVDEFKNDRQMFAFLAAE